MGKLEITDHIIVTIVSSKRVIEAAKKHEEYIKQETLCDKLILVENE